MAYSIKTIFWLILLNILLLLIISSYLFLFWVLLLPLRFLCIDAYMKIEKVFYDCLLGLIVATEWFSGTEVREMGAELTLHVRTPTPDCKLLMMANHQSFCDVLVTIYSFMSHTGYSILWVVYEGFKYTSFGLVCSTHGDFFVGPRNFKEGDLVKHVQKSYNQYKNLYFIFPEGGIKKNIQESNDRYIQKMGLPPMRNVVYPRFKAFADLLHPSIDLTHIVDLTILYSGQPSGMFEVLVDSPKEPIILLYKIYEVIDEGDAAASREYHPYVNQIQRNQITNEWLIKIWREKDELIDLFNNDKAEFMRLHSASERHIEVNFFMVFCTHMIYFLLIGFMIIIMYTLFVVL